MFEEESFMLQAKRKWQSSEKYGKNFSLKVIPCPMSN
jgi:hypothetical protein